MVIIQVNVTKRVGDEAGRDVGVDVGQFHQGNQGRPGVPGSIITGELVKGGKWITIQARLNPKNPQPRHSPMPTAYQLFHTYIHRAYHKFVRLPWFKLCLLCKHWKYLQQQYLLLFLVHSTIISRVSHQSWRSGHSLISRKAWLMSSSTSSSILSNYLDLYSRYAPANMSNRSVMQAKTQMWIGNK
jgi:hypothetical protein